MCALASADHIWLMITSHDHIWLGRQRGTVSEIIARKPRARNFASGFTTTHIQEVLKRTTRTLVFRGTPWGLIGPYACWGEKVKIAGMSLVTTRSSNSWPNVRICLSRALRSRDRVLCCRQKFCGSSSKKKWLRFSENQPLCLGARAKKLFGSCLVVHSRT